MHILLPREMQRHQRLPSILDLASQELGLYYLSLQQKGLLKLKEKAGHGTTKYDKFCKKSPMTSDKLLITIEKEQIT